MSPIYGDFGDGVLLHIYIYMPVIPTDSHPVLRWFARKPRRKTCRRGSDHPAVEREKTWFFRWPYNVEVSYPLLF